MSPEQLRRAAPAWATLALGLAAVLLRPALPIDETRYLEVFRESLEGGGLLLRLGGEPYAEKPPLLFWLGRGLVTVGVPMHLALRVVPVLASALTVLLVERVGRRAGAALAGWVQAVLLLPLLAGQVLLFDALLALAVWGALEAWTRRHEGGVAAWSAVALLAKGPVAGLFLVPLLWALRPLRGPGAGDGRRAALALGLALLPLTAWALSAARAGGPEFASALLWERWGGRIAQTHEHVRPWWFYVPIVLLGSLPATPFLFSRRTGPAAPEWARRLLAAGIVVLAIFTLVRGKQAHYLVPAAPVLALLVAQRLEHDPRTVALLHRGLLAQVALILVLLAATATVLPRLQDSYGSAGRAWIAAGGQAAPLLASMPRVLLLLSFVTWGSALLALHHIAGRALFPRELAAALRQPHAQLACLGSRQHGLYSLLADKTSIAYVSSPADLVAFSAGAPEALLVAEVQRLPHGVPPELEVVARDTVHRTPVLVLRAARTQPAARPDEEATTGRGPQAGARGMQ